MDVRDVHNKLLTGNDMALCMKYYGRESTAIFLSKRYGHVERYIGFVHTVNCEKNDFRDGSTFYGGNRSDCKFTWKLARETDKTDTGDYAGRIV